MMTYEEQEKIERLVAKDENAQKTVTALRDELPHWALVRQISHEISNPLTYIDSSGTVDPENASGSRAF